MGTLTGEQDVGSRIERFERDAPSSPFTAEQLAAYQTLRAETEAHVLGVPFLAAERQRHWPVGRILFDVDSATPETPNVADVHLYTHVAGIALWEVWLPGPRQGLDVSRWIAWLDDDDVPEGLPARMWQVLQPLNRELGGSDHYRQYLPCCVLRLEDQTLDAFLDGFSNDIVRLLWRDRSARALKQTVVETELARDYCAREGGITLLGRRAALDIHDRQDDATIPAFDIGVPPRSAMPFVLTLELLLTERAVLVQLDERLARTGPTTIGGLLELRREVTDSLEEYYGATIATTRFGDTVAEDGERILGIVDAYDAVMERLETVSFMLTTRYQLRMTELQFWLTVVFGATEIGFIASGLATWFYQYRTGRCTGLDCRRRARGGRCAGCSAEKADGEAMTQPRLPDDALARASDVDASVVTAGHLDSERTTSEALNRECFCISLDAEALDRALESELGQPGLYELVRQRCPYLFAAQPVFISNVHVQRMAQVVQAIESVVALPAYQQEVLARAPVIARHEPGNRGVFYGYDFHLDQGSLGLIEINTNAGGALLNAVLARAQRACCPAMAGMVPSPASIDAFERGIVAMFLSEWRLAGRTQPLRTIAIVDEAPEQQYLYPEFILFQRLFERHGISAMIADPAALVLRAGALWHNGTEVDLVYNRLTDFALADPNSAPLREAYVQRSVVLTPHPRAHALYADKRNLALLSDASSLRELGVSPSARAMLLDSIPHTEIVDVAHAERLWTERRTLFFKPTAGFGGRAAYRGDKVTKRVWQDILAGDYVAQTMVAPGLRIIGHHDVAQALKFDLRNYAYDGSVQWVAARLYQGQTTNFRTPGGGFAPVYTSADGQSGDNPVAASGQDIKDISPGRTTTASGSDPGGKAGRPRLS